MTGLLSVDAKGRIRRELGWARVVDGKAVQLDAPVVTTSIN
jgi:hypothetical protein